MIRQATQTQNRYIERIEQQLADSQASQLDYLVLAHNDDVMLDRLTSSFGDENLAIIALPQSGWAMDEEPLAELIRWSISDGHTKGVLLVGHSQGGTPADHVRLVTRPQQQNSQASNARHSLLDGVLRARLVVESCENHFVSQLQLVKQAAMAAETEENSNVQLHGLFYRAEVGVFCLYENNRFQAMIS